MALYRKKPVIVEAIQYDGTNFAEIQEFCIKEIICHYGSRNLQPKCIIIPDSTKNITININDWIIKNMNGEFESCDSDTFERIYERIASL
jgi:hypothetical protein